MLNKKNIILSVLIGLTLVGLLYLITYFHKAKNIYSPQSTCGHEGQIIGAAKSPTTCCEGLKRISGSNIEDYDNNCNLMSDSGLQVCSNCGNKICESDNWENKCNCPLDCE